MNIQFQKDLKKALVNSGMTQSSLSKACGVSQASISKIINGNTEIRLSTAIQLWPYVYGVPFPLSTSTTPPPAGQEQADG